MRCSSTRQAAAVRAGAPPHASCPVAPAPTGRMWPSVRRSRSAGGLLPPLPPLLLPLPPDKDEESTRRSNTRAPSPPPVATSQPHCAKHSGWAGGATPPTTLMLRTSSSCTPPPLCNNTACGCSAGDAAAGEGGGAGQQGTPDCLGCSCSARQTLPPSAPLALLPARLPQRIPCLHPPPPPPPGPEERSCSRGLGSQTEHDETEGQGGMTRQAGERPRRASEVATAPNSSSSLPTNPTHQQPLSLPAGRRSGCA